MPNKVFRNTSYVFGAFVVIAGIAASSAAGDDAGLDERFLTLSTAVAPWLISAVIVWAAGEIIKAMAHTPRE